MMTPPQTTRTADADAAAREFALEGCVVSARPYGAGHINDTYMIETAAIAASNDNDDDGDDTRKSSCRRRYILQRINSDVFRRPIEVMENVVRVCNHARSRLVAAGAPDADRRALRLVPTRAAAAAVVEEEEGTGTVDQATMGPGGDRRRPRWWHVDDSGDYWRCYHHVPNATGHEVASSPEQARSAAMAIGNFQSLLSDLPRDTRLHETIRDFHDTPRHLERLHIAVYDDAMGRASSARTEIEFALSRVDDASVLVNALRDGILPERVVHNDAKIGNVLLDDETNDGVCVVDLDTVMMGTVLYDFGDLVRTSTSSAPEDEVDLSRVTMRFDMFEALVGGYIDSTRDFLTSEERSFLPFSGKLITFEIGLRFLTDYLEGDGYFKVDRPGHNLDRARVQFRLVESIEEQMSEMQALVDGIV
ncbi:hypothetical protein ACHAXA_001825 [Cyclostephanos tholiformis]|uniref:Aminoglycoside phosphotransferase domain-containing protein n=1 Tax=Cyclostephanos tholiformis TaxID=382380 RepID=A0ABD3RCP4_9STRA